MSVPGLIAQDDGSWEATLEDWFNWDLSAENGNTTFELKREDGEVEGTATIGGIDIGTDDNHLTFGGGSQTINGSLKYGTSTFDILGGKFDLGDGRTEEFQLSFTADQTPFGPQWTGVGTNTLEDEKTFQRPSEGPATSYEPKLPTIEKKDLLFDIAGVVIPSSTFVGWTKRLEFSVKVNIEAKEKEVTVTITRELTLEVRPLFNPFPGFDWPNKPPFPPPFVDPSKVPRITDDIIALKAFFKAMGDSLNEVRTWKRVHELMDVVDKCVKAVEVASLAVAAATVVTVAFAGLNPAADFAEGTAIATLSTETAAMGTAKLALASARKGLTWGAEKISVQLIRKTILPKILEAVRGPATRFAGRIVVDEYFGSLSKEFGLESADGDLGKMEESLIKMQSSVEAKLQQSEIDLKSATEEQRGAADKAHRLLEYHTLLGSWTAHPEHAPFFNWAKTNLRITDSSEDAEVVDLGDISDHEKLLKAVAKQEEYARSKGYNGFVIILTTAKAYFRNRDVDYLLGTLDSEFYARDMISYIRAERISMDTLVSRWSAIDSAARD